MGLRDRVVDAIEGEARREQEELEREVQKTRESRKYRKLAKHGEVPVPGRATLDLPSGKVKLRYVESIRAKERASDAGGLSFRAPKDLLIRIVPAGGSDTIEVTPRKIPGPGPYEVSVEGGNEGAVEPRVVFG